MTLLEALLKNDVEEGQVVEAEVRLGQGLYWERAHWKEAGGLMISWKGTLGSSTWVRLRGSGYTGEVREPK